MDQSKHPVVSDGGYGWVVCFAACTVQFLASGLQNNFGILYIYILKELSDGGKAKSGTVKNESAHLTLQHAHAGI